MPLGSSHTENPRVDGSWLPVVLLQLHLWPDPAVSLSHPLKTQTLRLPALGQDWSGWGLDSLTLLWPG